MSRTNQRIVVLLVVVLILVAAGVGIAKLFGSDSQKDDVTTVSDTSQGVSMIRVSQDYTVAIADDFSSMTVYGWLTNTSAKTLSVVLRLEVTDAKTGEALGEFTALVNNAESQKETPFAAQNKPFSSTKNVKVKITPVGSFAE